jgi:hypothetical protein
VGISVLLLRWEFLYEYCEWILYEESDYSGWDAECWGFEGGELTKRKLEGHAN